MLAWLNGQWALLAPEAVSALATIVLLVGLAGRFRRWWLVAAPVVVVIAAFFAFVSGWLLAGSVAIRCATRSSRRMRAASSGSSTCRARRFASRTSPTWTDQANAFTVGFGPSTHVILWDTLLDGRFTRGEEVVVIAHELGHVRSRHIVKASAGRRSSCCRRSGCSRSRRAGAGESAIPRTCRT